MRSRDAGNKKLLLAAILMALAEVTASMPLRAAAAAQLTPAPQVGSPTTGGSRHNNSKPDMKVKTLQSVFVIGERYDTTKMRLSSVNTVGILSANALQRTAAHSVAEELGLLPGVTVITTGTGYFGGIDGAALGEGMFASVRGLPPEFNVDLINGANVAQGMPYSRSVQLSLLPPSGFQTIVLSKTSTADMDGDAIGGTIDFRTPSAFDFNKDFSGSITAGGRIESRARDYGDNGMDSSVAGELQSKFGSEKQFGIYTSIYYDYRNVANSEFGAAESAINDGSWAFAHATANGRNAPGYDPAGNLVSTGTNVGIASGFERRYGGNLSLDWNVNQTLRAYAKMNYAYALTQQNTTYTQLLPASVTYLPSAIPGVYIPNIDRISNRFWFETNPEKADLATIQLGADKSVGGWTISPNLFWGFGDNDRPDHVEIGGREDNYSPSNFAYSGSSLLSYGSDDFPYPRLTQALLAEVNRTATMYAHRDGELTETSSGQKRGGGKLNMHYDFEQGALSSIKFGVKYSDSSRTFTNRDYSTAVIDDGTTTLEDLGIFEGSYASIFPGKIDWITPKVSESAVSNLTKANLRPGDIDTCSNLPINNYNCDTMRGTEAVGAAYAMATINPGALEIIPGIRFEHTSIRNTFWTTPYDGDGNELRGYFDNNHTVYNEPLGSLFLNYRLTENTVYRASIWQSYTRPAFVQLGGGSQINISDGVTTITQGNPNLKPIKATNFDISAEWTPNRYGYVSLSGFYKKLSHYIYDSGSSQANSDTSGNGTVLYTTPTNGGIGRVGGVEMEIWQKFQNLPAPWNGLGFSLNATRQNSRVDLGMSGFSREPLQASPRRLGNITLFYEKNGCSVDLSYHYTGSYLSIYDFLNQGNPWDDLWIRPVRRVDLHVGYEFDPHIRADLSINNLFRNYSYWSHIGQHSLAVSDIVDVGMSSLLTIKYMF